MSPSLQCGERGVGKERRYSDKNSDKNRDFGSADTIPLMTSDYDTDNSLELYG